MATHSNILAWKIPWTEKSGGLQSNSWGPKESVTPERNTHIGKQTIGFLFIKPMNLFFFFSFVHDGKFSDSFYVPGICFVKYKTVRKNPNKLILLSLDKISPSQRKYFKVGENKNNN